MNAVDLLVYVAASAPAWWLMLRTPRLPMTGGSRGPVSVIVPARNEEHQIADVVHDVVNQARDGDEVIVVDDDSSDATAECATRAGARVISAGELPPGWLGKPHACWVGARHAKNETLVFLDADVRLRDGALERVVHALRDLPSGLVSVQPYHQPRRWSERAALPFNVVSLVGSGAGSRSAHAIVFGPLLACSAARYRELGGHSAETVRATVVEDIALGTLFGRTKVFVGSADTVTFRMYPQGFRALVRGFTKNLATGARRAGPFPLAAAVAWVAAQVGAIVTAPWLYLLAVVQMSLMGRNVGRFHPLDAVTYPLHFTVFFAVLVRSALVRAGLGRVRWAGRRVR
ncbi:MAG: glycosyltransferase [Actinomycetota bacterium]